MALVRSDSSSKITNTVDFRLSETIIKSESAFAALSGQVKVFPVSNGVWNAGIPCSARASSHENFEKFRLCGGEYENISSMANIDGRTQ